MSEMEVQTEIEKRLGISVVDAAYPPGHVRRYGATDNARAVDDAQTVNRAMTPVLTNGVDIPDPADMARWLRERKEAVVEFLKLDSEDQQRQFLNRWQQNVLPHLAFRFVQAAEMIERLAEDCRELIAERDGLNAKVCELLKQLHHEPREKPACNHLPLQAPWCNVCNPQNRDEPHA